MHRALILCALALSGPAAAAPNPGRDALWVALKTCVLAKRLADRAFPCLSVDLGEPGRPGTAVLRAPGEPTHFVLMPTETVSGLEAPVLRGPAGAAYWRAALAARHLVSDAARGEVSTEDVGLAVNSVGGRSQDQLHIHLGCVRPAVRGALQRAAGGLGGAWTLLPTWLQGSRFFALRIDAERAAAFNPFAALSQLPGRRTDLRDVSLAVVALPSAGQDAFVLLAYRAPRAHAEKLLDPACTAAL